MHQRPKLIETLIALPDQLVPRGHWVAVFSLCLVFEAVVKRSIHTKNAFIALGGLEACDKALHHVLASCTMLESKGTRLLDTYFINHAVKHAINASCACWGILCENIKEGRPPKLSSYAERQHFQELTSLLYQLCYPEHFLAYMVVYCVSMLTHTVDYAAVQGVNHAAMQTASRDLLSCSGGISSIPFAVKIVRVLRSAVVEVDRRTLWTGIMESNWHAYPSIHAAVERDIGTVHSCAHLGCHCTSVFRHRLKHCVRCKAAWYCSREHQVAHWPEHKRTCKPSKTAVGAEAEESQPKLL